MLRRRFILIRVALVAILVFTMIRVAIDLSSAEIKEDQPSGGEQALLLVRFKRNITLQEATELIEQHELEMDSRNTGRRWRRRPHMVIIVPADRVYEWIDRLELEDGIRSVRQYYQREDIDVSPETED